MSEKESFGHGARRRESLLHHVWHHYRFELIWLIAVSLGLFLLLEQMNLRASLSMWLRNLATRLLGGFQQLDSQLSTFLTRFSFSDVLGFLLIAGAGAAILLRIRSRLLTHPGLTAVTCPKCGAPIHRVHRKMRDRLISMYVPVRRYRCSNAACRWRGLRIGKQHGSVQHRAAPAG